MGNKTLSKHVKSLNRSKLKESKLHAAVDAYPAEQLKPECDRLSLCDITCIHGIPTLYSTIGKRYNGQQSITEAHQSLQKLTLVEEKTLVNFLNESAERGFPQAHEQIENFANTILQRKSKRAAREQFKAEWKLIKEEHERAVEAWKLRV